jgi:hypothetical protein
MFEKDPRFNGGHVALGYDGMGPDPSDPNKKSFMAHGLTSSQASRSFRQGFEAQGELSKY